MKDFPSESSVSWLASILTVSTTLKNRFIQYPDTAKMH